MTIQRMEVERWRLKLLHFIVYKAVMLHTININQMYIKEYPLVNFIPYFSECITPKSIVNYCNILHGTYLVILILYLVLVILLEK